MLGRRLDRYVTSFFAWHFVVCFLAVMGLYVLVDTFAHLDEFVEHESLAAQVGAIAAYHAYETVVLAGRFLPIVTLLAGIIALARLSKYNELNAVKAAGVSIQRALLPVMGAAFAIGLLGAADQELLVPWLETDILAARDAKKDNDVYDEVFAYDEKHRTSVMVQRLLNAAHGCDLGRVEAVPGEPAANGVRKATPTLEAARGVWVDRWVFLFDGQATETGGEPKPFACRTVLLDVAAKDYAPPDEPQAKLRDGTPAHRVGATLDGHPLDVTFAAFKPITCQRMILRGQITPVHLDGDRTAPTDVAVALWHEGKWLGRAQTYRQATAVKRDLVTYDGDELDLSLSPQQLIQTRTDPTLKSMGELVRLANRIPALRQRILLDLHVRLTLPIVNVVLLMVALPLLFQQEGGRSTLLGVGLALTVGGAFYIASYAFQAIGRDPEGIFGGLPWLAASLPTLLFALVGAILLYNMDT